MIEKLCMCLLVVSLGCAHTGPSESASPRGPATAAERLPERTLRSILALSSESNAALVQTMVRGRQLTYEVCPVEIGTLKTNAEVLRYLNSGISTCVNVNAYLFDARQPKATDIINHLTFRKLQNVAADMVASKKVPVDFEKSALAAITIMFAKFRSEPYSGDLNLSAFQLEAREIYVGTLAAMVQLLTLDTEREHTATLLNDDPSEQSPNTLERAIAETQATAGRGHAPRGADVFKLLVEATNRATQIASRKLRMVRPPDA